MVKTSTKIQQTDEPIPRGALSSGDLIFRRIYISNMKYTVQYLDPETDVWVTYNRFSNLRDAICEAQSFTNAARVLHSDGMVEYEKEVEKDEN